MSEYRLTPIARLLLGMDLDDDPTPVQPPADHGDGSGAGGREEGEGA